MLSLVFVVMALLFPLTLQAGAVDDTFSTDYGTTLTGNVLTNDTGMNKEVTAFWGLTCGDLTLLADGSFTYEPGTCTGTVTFDYRMEYGRFEDTATVTITINGIPNTPPNAADDTATTDEDQAVTIDVLANDSDPDGDTLSISSVSTPAHGSATINGDAIDYTPDVGFSGDDTFTYTITDGTASSTATVTVSVVLVCHGCDCSLDDDTQNSTSPGIAIPDLDHASSSVSTCLSGMSNGTIDNVQTDYYHFTVDAESTFSVSTDSPNGHEFHLRIEVNGTEVYPDTIALDHSFTTDLSPGDLVVLYFKEHGDDLDEYEAQLTLTVHQVNHPPVALDDAAATSGAPVTIDVLTNDSDPDGDTLHVISTTTPRLGSVTINSDDTITYTPYDLYSCADSFSYTISDGNATATATVTIATTSTKTLGGDLQIFNRDDPSPDPAKVGEDVVFTLNTQNRIRTTHSDIITEISYNQDVTIVDAYQYDPYTTYYGYVCDKRSGLLPAGEKITCTKNTDWTSITNYKDLKIIVQPSQPDLLVQNAIIYSTADNDPVCINNTATTSVDVFPIAAVDDEYVLYGGGSLDANILENDYGNDLEIVRTDPDTASIPGLTLSSDGDITFVSDGNTTQVSFTYTVRDSGGLEDNATVTITVLPHEGACGKPHAFESRYTSYVPGDLVAIGNANICADEDHDGRCDPDQLKRNDTSNIIYNNIYSSPELAASGEPGWLKNTSGAVLDLPEGAEVQWAGLYWHGEVWNFKTHDPALTTSAGIDTGALGLEMMSKEDRVQFKVPGSDYVEVQADDHYYIYLKRWEYSSYTYGYGYVDQMTGTSADYNPDYALDFTRKTRYEEHYQGFKDVTAMLQAVEAAQGSANGTYWVGDIQATLGKLWYPGVEAGWTLQVVYSLPNAQPRSIAITDGYVALYSSASQGSDYAAEFGCPTDAASTGVYAYTVDFDIENLMTPKKPGFTTDMTVFVTESDPEDSSTTEYLKITRKDGSSYLVDGYNAWNYEIKKKDGSDNLDRTPDYIYPIGMTLKNYRMTDALSVDQNSTHVTFSTDSDRLILGVIGFATDMNAPELCYDYDIRIGDYINLPSTDRNFTAQQWGDKDLQIKVLIRSKEADFDFENAKLRLTFTPSDVFEYRTGESEISPEGINAYLPAVETDSALGEIAIGHDFGSDGGILGPEESTYIKQRFSFLQSSFVGRFDIHVDGNVSYIPGQPPVGYHLSTEVPLDRPGHIGRCPTNPVYDPIWGQFNIENNNSTLSDPDEERYPLYTQIAGRPYGVRVVSYEQNTTSGAYDIPYAVTATVEMELIDVSPFDNNASAGYDSTCQEPVAASKGAFVHFNNEESITVAPTSFPDYDDHLVLRNAAFRIWMLTRSVPGTTSRALVYHNCDSADDSSCFDALYANVYKNGDDNQTKYCESDCTNSSDSTCYDCLRTYFARPVCSRDNFSIRPEGFRIVLNDTNEQNSSSTVNELIRNISGSQETNLSAGYRYQLKVEATSYGNQGEFGDETFRTKAYYNNFNTQQTVTPLPEETRDRGTVALLDFNDSTACADTNNTAMGLVMYDSITPSDESAFSHSNAGQYSFWISDGTWTQVDQGDYPFKPVFDPDCSTDPQLEKCFDCLLPDMTATPPKVGCSIRSNYPGDAAYTDLTLRFNPYRFDTGRVQLSFVPSTDQKYLFMNDFSQDYYQDPISQTIDMGAILAGSISAMSKDNRQMTNFTDSCAASDIRLNLSMGDFNGTLQEYLQHTSDTNAYEDNQSSINNAEVNLTLPKDAFVDASGGNTTAAGSAYVRISTTIRKPERTDIPSGADGINPVKLLYKNLVATGDKVPSQAFTADDPSHIHIPTGKTDYNQSVTFVYGKITPLRRFYDAVEADEKTTPLFVDVYCDKGTDQCADEFNLTTASQGENENSDVWYWIENRFALPGGGNGLGTTDLVTSLLSGRNVPSFVATQDIDKDTMIQDMPFEDDATRNDITVSVESGTYRPVIVKVCYEPVPWLIYDPCDPNDPTDPGKDYYRVRFIGHSNWAGVGPTGHVVKTRSSNEGKTRMNW